MLLGVVVNKCTTTAIVARVRHNLRHYFNVKGSVLVHKGVVDEIGIDPNSFTPFKVTIVVKES